MNNIYTKIKTCAKIMVPILVLVIALGGCEPLRKKFTRKKKKDTKESSEFIPVLDPIDYPATMVSSESRYKHHYQLWMVWQKDLLTVLGEDGSQKRIIYINSQIIKQLEEVQKYISEEKQKELAKHIGSYQSLDDNMRMPSVMRDNLSIMRKANRIGRRIRKDFTFNAIKDSIK